jgi:hypothetical protein
VERGPTGIVPYGNFGVAYGAKSESDKRTITLRGVKTTLPSAWIPLARLPRAIRNAKLIVSKFAAAGLGTAAGLAAVVNAMDESQLDHRAIAHEGPTDPNDRAAGLFQLAPWGTGECGAAGYGMSLSARRNRRRNVNRIIDVVKGRKKVRLPSPTSGSCVQTTQFRDMAKSGASIAQLTVQFCEEIERPGPGKCSKRASTARRMFGDYADMPGGSLPQLGRVGGVLVSTPWYYWLTGTLVVGIGVLLWMRRRRRR